MAAANQITVYDLYNTMRERQQRHNECYTIVLDRVYCRIKRCASVNRYTCTFEVPQIIVGKPLFNVESCLRYVMHNLTSNGFRVRYSFPRTLDISWDMRERQQQQQQHQRHPLQQQHQQHQQQDLDPAVAMMMAGRQPPRHQQQQQGHGNGRSRKPAAAAAAATRVVVTDDRNNTHNAFFRSITEFKPSGKFVLNL